MGSRNYVIAIVAVLLATVGFFVFKAAPVQSPAFRGSEEKKPIGLVRAPASVSTPVPVVSTPAPVVHTPAPAEASPVPLVAPADKSKVAVIGAGNIGSFLTLHLRSAGFTVAPFDVNPTVPHFEAAKKHSRDLSWKELQDFGTVIFLGGCTGRRACAALSLEARLQANVHDVAHIVGQLSSNQNFITASTSAVSEGRMNAKESDAVYSHLLDEYSSSMFQREHRLQEMSSRSESPSIIMLRFGTVAGVSPGQRTDLLIPSLFKQAYTTGVLKVQGHDGMRSFLALPDLCRAIQALVSRPPTSKFKVYNLASFHAKIMKVATTISSITGSRLDMRSPVAGEKLANPPVSGFSLDCRSFAQDFHFTFQEDLQSTLLEMDTKIPESIMPKGSHKPEEKLDSIPCPVCGSTNLQLVVDLGDQPFANDFVNTTTRALASPRFPLKLVRCRVCNHYHLSHVASRSDLFEHYLYRSGTSATLKEHFDFLAMKVKTESGKEAGSILEIACNDGTQLDSFKALGWKTYGVDPAKNIAALAQDRHTVRVGFWPLDFPELPKGDDLTAITAQNVFAHVPHPVDFLKGCVSVMGPKTRLYIQTSQCDMQQLGQFDTMYHEHISFFTGHSFLKAAELAGLYIVKFETTPIHGNSCLVTLQLSGENADKSLEQRLAKERLDGVTSEFFAEQFMARAYAIREFVSREVQLFRLKGYVVGAYGAAAKGMTLLHFILGAWTDSSRPFLDFVLDDAPLKQKTFCPGTEIPVRQTDYLQDIPRNYPLAIVVLAWNFFEEIAMKTVRLTFADRKNIIAILPFPEPRVVRLQEKQHRLLRRLGHDRTPIPNPLRDATRRKVTMVTHFRNEEMLMPFFIIQHAPLFDRVVAIDFLSSDRSVQMLQDYAPASWRIVTSKTGLEFDAKKTDAQVMTWERKYPDDWVIALTTTEFLIHPRLRLDLYTRQQTSKGPLILVNPSIAMVGYDGVPLKHFTSLIKQRYVFRPGSHSEPGGKKSYVDRVIHYGTSNTYAYSIGRHTYVPQPGKPKNAPHPPDPDGFIAKWAWTPWPEQGLRKIEMGRTISAGDQQQGFGSQHTAAFKTGFKPLNEKRRAWTRAKTVHNLCDDNDDIGAARPELANVSRVFFEEIGGGCSVEA